VLAEFFHTPTVSVAGGPGGFGNGYSGVRPHQENPPVSIRFASLSKQIEKNGQKLHRAMKSRAEGAEPSPAEILLIDERRLLKEEQVQRKTRALQPKPSALDRLVRTRHAQPKDKSKTAKESTEAKETKKPKVGKSRADKQAQKDAALEAARKSSRKTATK
jgi:hypothetical protein